MASALAPCSTARWPFALNVLLAEDNPVNQEVAVGLLEMLDCAVTVVENGKAAVDAAADRRFDIVLMDCQMPVMDGLEATRAIRTALAGERLPIVALTANNLDEAKNDCLEAGMDDLLCKPFRGQDLRALLDRWCPAPASDAAKPPGSEPLSLDPEPIEMLKSLDPTGEKQLVRRTIEKFSVYGDDLIAQLAKGVREKDAVEVSRLTHSLKSSSASLGAKTLARLCAEMEDATCKGELPEDIDRRLDLLTATHRSARQDLLTLING